MANRPDRHRFSGPARIAGNEQDMPMPPLAREASAEMNDGLSDGDLVNEVGAERDAPEIPVREMAPSESGEWWAESFPNERERFAAQAPDFEWGALVEAVIYRRVSQLADFPVTTLRAECRETMCRLVVYYPPDTNAMLAFSSRIVNMTRDLETVSVFAESTMPDDVVQSTIVYLTFSRDDPQDAMRVLRAIV